MRNVISRGLEGEEEKRQEEEKRINVRIRIKRMSIRWKMGTVKRREENVEKDGPMERKILIYLFIRAI